MLWDGSSALRGLTCIHVLATEKKSPQGYHIIKSMYTNNKCPDKIGNKHTHFFPQGRGVTQGCSLSPTLFNVYFNELARSQQQSAASGLTFVDSLVKYLLFADDLVRLSPINEGLVSRHWGLLLSLLLTLDSKLQALLYH